MAQSVSLGRGMEENRAFWDGVAESQTGAIYTKIIIKNKSINYTHLFILRSIPCISLLSLPSLPPFLISSRCPVNYIYQLKLHIKNFSL